MTFIISFHTVVRYLLLSHVFFCCLILGRDYGSLTIDLSLFPKQRSIEVLNLCEEGIV